MSLSINKTFGSLEWSQIKISNISVSQGSFTKSVFLESLNVNQPFTPISIQFWLLHWLNTQTTNSNDCKTAYYTKSRKGICERPLSSRERLWAIQWFQVAILRDGLYNQNNCRPGLIWLITSNEYKHENIRQIKILRTDWLKHLGIGQQVVRLWTDLLICS